MPVIPYTYNLLNNKQDIKKFILAHQNKNSASSQAEIISISKEIDPIDPLFFLATMKQANQLSFYCENQRKKEAVVAIGNIKNFTIDSQLKRPKNLINISFTSTNRFVQCQNFIDYYQDKIARVGDLVSNNIPYFFAHFNFFDEQDKNNNSFPLANIFVPYLQLIKKQNKYFLIVNTLKEDQKKNTQLLDTFFSDKNDNSNNNGYKHNYFLAHQKIEISNRKIDENEYDSFIEKVIKALSKIRDNKLTKIVVAQALEIYSDSSFNLIQSLQNLRYNHPDCYIFCISNNQEDYFVGASPERLLSIQDNQLVTDALAGSAPRGEREYEDQILGEKLLNSDKEKREHETVSDFIVEHLSQLDLKPKKASLQLLKLRNIQHLWTPIYAHIPFNLKPLEIIAQLHPTPAVAGVPIDIACQEIKNYENFDRSLYAAPLGWIDCDHNCEFIVGIRSALIKNNKARLYAGAGIVAGSNPQQELTEIKLKFQPLLRALI